MYLKKEMERFGEVEAGFGAGRLIVLMISQNDTSLHHIAPTTTSGAGLLSYSSLACLEVCHMGNRDKPEEEPPFVRGNLRFFGVSKDEKLQWPTNPLLIVDCGILPPLAGCAGGFPADVF